MTQPGLAPAHDTPTVALHTLGCRLNQYETEAIREQFVLRGFHVVPFSGPADVYVVNTCTVTNQADASARQALRRAVRTVRTTGRDPTSIVVATGCYAQTNPGQLLEIEGVDLVLGNAEKGDLVDHVLTMRAGDPPTSRVTRRAEMAQFDERLDVSAFENRTRATLKIQDGCDQFCSFCIIPWARGRHRSLPPDAVMRQVQTLVDRGYAEIVLTGVHLGEYGTDLPTPVTLNDVVRQILERTTLPRLRLSSIWPTAVDRELIDLFGNHAPRLCRYTHLAVQHGDDQLLGAMRRTYTAGQAEEVVERLVDAVPDICIGADVMVGFPGETDASFQRMYDRLDRQPYAYFHVFSYSKRDHTRAARMPDQVPPPTARERSELLRTMSDRKSAAYNSRFRGRKLLVLVEEESDEGKMTGRTDHGLRCWFEGRAEQVNTFVEVEVDATDARGATGRLSIPDARDAGADDTVPAIGGATGRVPVADATL
ncbi:MAG: tRNA (N(6)-L-threonylcarbamoyladenosine(37)-C(2))-methylthiotransferase MtaB [Gemmatimonadetes bacterium]|nr:tRNA (N(6)-L-threonylcarbamoyladenosine(37)-C(2))-methylthiotransferase MtaB [Gemmatimonadota bacterium]MYD25987.1 tRNA (N(6)-L-threonylcarbamoyladenosine(37)-C(2))-methylthiotransferase MtaB [Gemmatimonadota bacterium]MYI98486.1 tRNA (N(6)-L-threonylcarbamoyladenosine(37)-C(2))-methylthiotransferase MtaB [Gemmatimonadota bacterium]